MRYYFMSRTNHWALTVKMMGYSAFIIGNMLRPSLLLALATMPGLLLVYKCARYIGSSGRQRRPSLMYPTFWRGQPFLR